MAVTGRVVRSVRSLTESFRFNACHLERHRRQGAADKPAAGDIGS